ncbi:MAG: hypothetical protein WD898_01770 [Candidatus Paceibacterota bacterium]
MRKLTLAFVTLVVLLSTACVKNYRGEFMTMRDSRGNTEEEKLAAYYDSFRFVALEWDSDKNEFRPSFKKLTYANLEDQLNERLEDYAQILDYKQEDMAKFIDHFGLRSEFEREEEVLELARNRVRVARIYNNFQKFMGTRSSSSSYSYGSNRHDPYESLDISTIYDPKDMKTVYAFDSELINRARQDKTLKPVEEFAWTSDRTYGVKEADPANPDDPNKFTWRHVKMGMKFKSYKVISDGTEKPRDNQVDYIEGFRLIDGKEESLPALRLYVLQYQSVLVIDQDKENELGFGLPEVVEKLSKVTSGISLMDERVVSVLFPDKPKEKRVKPPEKPEIKVEIATVGQPVDLWEQSKDSTGWKTPMYKNNRGDNYDVRVKFARHEHGDDPDSPESRLRQIEHLMKRYTGINKAVEYYKPKSPFDTRNILQADDGMGSDGKRLRVEFDNGEEKTGNVTSGQNIFTQENPEKIAYSDGGKRFVVWDKDGDGTFEMRMEVSLDSHTGTEKFGDLQK